MTDIDKRVEKLENNFSDMQKLLYEVLANVKSINNNIEKAINLEEKVIVFWERQKVIKVRLDKCEIQREGIQKDISILKNKLAYYSGAILVISLLVPYILNVLFH